MPLHYLDFDYSEDSVGVGTFEAMASVRAEQLPALQAEIARVLDWAFTHFPARGAVGEDGDWDYALHGQQEVVTPECIVYHEGTRSFTVQLGEAGPPRHTVTLSISGTEGFSQALRQQFDLA